MAIALASLLWQSRVTVSAMVFKELQSGALSGCTLIRATWPGGALSPASTADASVQTRLETIVRDTCPIVIFFLSEALQPGAIVAITTYTVSKKNALPFSCDRISQ